MARFTDAQLSKWALDYEKEITVKHNLIADRISLAIISGVSEYELPNYVSNIRSVLYKGKELHAKSGRGSIITGDTPFTTSTSTPYEYVTSLKGLRTIKLFPSPGDTIAEYVGDLWTAAADEAAFIVEFYRTADSTEVELSLPTWLRRYIIKDYVCFKAFNAEGPKQHLVAAKYYQNKLYQQESYIDQIKENMNRAQMTVLYDAKMQARRKPGRPVLPSNFGYPLNG